MAELGYLGLVDHGGLGWLNFLSSVRYLGMKPLTYQATSRPGDKEKQISHTKLSSILLPRTPRYPGRKATRTYNRTFSKQPIGPTIPQFWSRDWEEHTPIPANMALRLAPFGSRAPRIPGHGRDASRPIMMQDTSRPINQSFQGVCNTGGRDLIL